MMSNPTETLPAITAAFPRDSPFVNDLHKEGMRYGLINLRVDQ